MKKIAEFLPPYPTRLWQLVGQAGATHAVGMLPYDPQPGALDAERNAPRSWGVNHGVVNRAEVARLSNGAYPWEYESLRDMQARFAAAGLELGVIESSPPMENVRLGLPARDEEIELICTMLRAMGHLGIPVWCYNFLAVASWGRTSMTTPARGGALVTAFDLANLPPLTLPSGLELTHERLWDNFRYFLERVLPVAEEVGVKLAVHPDDPPLPWVGPLPRILTSVEAFERMLDMCPSPANGITFCQGNFGLMPQPLPGLIREWGSRGKIFFVHFRNVRGSADRFEETFPDDGQTDMLACLRAYQAIGFEGLLRPDHVPTLAGESNDSPGYETLGRLYALGYVRGLCEAVYGSPGHNYS